MTRPFLILIILAFALNVSAQTFEGKIVYKVSYKSKTKGMSDARFTSLLGSEQHYFIKGGNYRSNGNGTLFQWQLFRNEDNKLYNKFSNSETITWEDGARNDDPVTKTQINKGVGKILGYEVDEVVLTTKNGLERHYVSSQLPVDPNLFVNHKFGNWHHLISQLRALPLKFVVEDKELILEAVAIEVKETKLDDKIFALPAGVKTAKMPPAQ